MKNVDSHSVLNFGFFEDDFRISDYPIAVIINCEQGIWKGCPEAAAIGRIKALPVLFGNVDWKTATLTDGHVSNSIVTVT